MLVACSSCWLRLMISDCDSFSSASSSCIFEPLFARYCNASAGWLMLARPVYAVPGLPIVADARRGRANKLTLCRLVLASVSAGCCVISAAFTACCSIPQRLCMPLESSSSGVCNANTIAKNSRPVSYLFLVVKVICSAFLAGMLCGYCQILT